MKNSEIRKELFPHIFAILLFTGSYLIFWFYGNSYKAQSEMKGDHIAFIGCVTSFGVGYLGGMVFLFIKNSGSLLKVLFHSMLMIVSVFVGTLVLAGALKIIKYFVTGS